MKKPYFFRFFCSKALRALKYLRIFPDPINQIISNDMLKNDFKKAIRRVFWFIEYKYLGYSPIKDHYFDFSIGLTTNQALETYHYLEKKKYALSQSSHHVTLAQLSSAVLETQVQPGESKNSKQLEHHKFHNIFDDHILKATALLHASKPVKPQHSKKTPKTKTSTFNPLKKHALGALKEVLDFFKKNKIPVFAISGTFLGLIREKDFIKHDTDIDLGVFEKDFKNNLYPLLHKLPGFTIKTPDYPCFRIEKTINNKKEVFYAKASVPALIKIYHHSGIQIDLFIHFHENNVTWHGSSIHRWENTTFDLIERDFLGLKVLTPKNEDLYLTENYGTWKIPVTDFNCSTGTPNLAPSGTCKNKCYFLKRSFYEQTN